MSVKRNERNPKSETIARMIMEEYRPENKEDINQAMKEIFGPMFEACCREKWISIYSNANN